MSTVRPSFGDYHPDDRVSRPVAAQLCGPVSPRTLEDWARDGKGPPFQKLGTGRSARVVYRVGDLLDWLDAQTRASTTTDPEAA
ncbi:MAG: helix-turn-helix domain-containing protein [Myxococcales bacterium]|nr:helix-turn-helix domain-containing protein [Myxococcales bacterium]